MIDTSNPPGANESYESRDVCPRRDSLAPSGFRVSHGMRGLDLGHAAGAEGRPTQKDAVPALSQ